MMKVTFETDNEKAAVLTGLRILQQRQYESDSGPLWSGIPITVLEQAIACVQGTLVSFDDQR